MKIYGKISLVLGSISLYLILSCSDMDQLSDLGEQGGATDSKTIKLDMNINKDGELVFSSQSTENGLNKLSALLVSGQKGVFNQTQVNDWIKFPFPEYSVKILAENSKVSCVSKSPIKSGGTVDMECDGNVQTQTDTNQQLALEKKYCEDKDSNGIWRVESNIPAFCDCPMGSHLNLGNGKCEINQTQTACPASNLVRFSNNQWGCFNLGWQCENHMGPLYEQGQCQQELPSTGHHGAGAKAQCESSGGAWMNQQCICNIDTVLGSNGSCVSGQADPNGHHGHTNTQTYTGSQTETYIQTSTETYVQTSTQTNTRTNTRTSTQTNTRTSTNTDTGSGTSPATSTSTGTGV